MTTLSWFYIKDNNRIGPVSQEQLCELFRSGALPLETLVWCQYFPRWSPASSIPGLRALTGGGISVVSREQLGSEGDATPAINWLCRFGARFINLFGSSIIAALGFGVVCGLLGIRVAAQHLNALVIEFGSLFGWTIVEAFLVAAIGTTPGKWLLGISVRESDGTLLSFSRSLARSFRVLVLGVGLGLPVVSLCTLLVGCIQLGQTGNTPWDRAGNYRVWQRPMGIGRGLTLAFLAMLSILALWSVMHLRMT